ncbi:MAG: Molybdenum cofactor biosynthesis enzyme MoaC [Candidatus Methanohalarchaeum thermophilum]|uniref:Molybdenum cofactor biosynthesis enzyme MoaC n=1 Tax=Methanohalarchaeum thermophilum TaxID=1903181 RepID=A0A1Q6DWC8_METT1|nr:MAG: Molybdenum cofactor biosynthesis enzyme MoaC [Candidatus Methanohalarchaeum thermophilum]
MVDISDKKDSIRESTATGSIELKNETVKSIKEDKISKGNVLATSRVAAIESVKNTSSDIPLCHNIKITGVDIDYEIEDEAIKAKVTVKTTDKTGVEMEALNGVSTALLTIWDMVKSKEKDKNGQYPSTEINSIKVDKKIKREIK